MPFVKKFTRNIEDFTCANCGAVVRGNGYTNHCPVCLWSRHVDINPGDRANPCGGAMRPIGAESSRGKWMILHRCEKCGATRRVHVAEKDNMDAVIRLTTNS